MSAQLSLTAEEASTLKAVLEDYLSDLRMEIVDTDSSEFKDGLREKKRLLRGIADRLGAAG